MIQTTYGNCRRQLEIGDVIAFGGRSAVSIGIKAVTNCNVSHVGIILKTKVEYCDEVTIQLIESTSLGEGLAGVKIQRLSTVVAQYNGNMWVLPLSSLIQETLLKHSYTQWLVNQIGKPYDVPQALWSGLDGLFPDTEEDFSRLFCSELVCGGLKAGGVIEGINCSEQTPKDVCSFPIWFDPYQIKGTPQELL